MAPTQGATPITPGPIATRVIARLLKSRSASIVDLAAFRAGTQHVAELQATVASAQRLNMLHPVHALFVHMQNQVSILTETISELPELNMLRKIIIEAEDRYLPQGPPMSPLTTSHFVTWATFDVAVGPRKESLATIVLAVCPVLGADRRFVEVLKVVQASRLGLYVREASDGDARFRLRELVTNERFSCIVPSGWIGTDGELWLGRIVAPLCEGAPHQFVTTPYVLLDGSEAAWHAYFARTLPVVTAETYVELMKAPADRDHWNEFIFKSYVNHEQAAIFLSGMPDKAESRPPSNARR